MKSLAYASFILAAIFAILVAAAFSATGESPHVADVLLVAIPATIGVVLWILDPSFTSSFATPLRVVAYLTGIFVMLSGMLWLNYVGMHGDGTSYMITTVDDHAQVYVIDEATGGEEVVFEGTEAEANAWVSNRIDATADRTRPTIAIGVGALVTLASLGLGWHRTGERRHHVGTTHGHLAA